MNRRHHAKAYILWRIYKMRRRFKRLVCSRLYWDRDRSLAKSILVAGTARSGTTWLADVLTQNIRGRLMFEPFYKRLVSDYSQFNYYQYMRPSERDPNLLQFCEKVLTGSIRHPWIDRQVETLLPRQRVIKTIRANLFLRWLSINIPELPIIFMIRHPCAVVLSRLNLGWEPDADISPFLAQEKLVADFLTDQLEFIRQAESVEEKHAIIWCISNLVPLQQFKQTDLCVLFYENLCLEPIREFGKAFQLINCPFDSSIVADSRQPSTTSLPSSAVVQGHNKVTAWQTALTRSQIERILTTVRVFGLDNLYGNDVVPDESAIEMALER